MRRHSLFQVLLATGLLCACVQEQKLEFAKGGGVEKQDLLPPEEPGQLDGFILSGDALSMREVISGRPYAFSEQDEIYLKSTIYHPSVDAEGRAGLDVPQAASGEYIMFLYPQGSRCWFTVPEEAPFSGLVIPYSQFYGTTAELFGQYPMLGEPAGDGTVTFREVLGAVSVQVSGDTKLASVHIRNNSTGQTQKANLAGIASYTVDGTYELNEGVNFVNLNCTNHGEGVQVTAQGKTFYLLVSPGNYPDGLTLTLTGMDHKGQVYQVKPLQVAAGEVVALEQAGGGKVFGYAPDKDLLFFEHFDNFVWGGNVQGNEAVSSYAPDAMANPGDTPLARTGYEQAFTKVGTVTPGSALIQSNWASVNGWTVGKRADVSAEYIKSRNIGDLVYMYRCQEFQGCISVGGGDEVRGGYTPFKAGGIPDFNPDTDLDYRLQVSFDVCLRYGVRERFGTRITGSGIASKVLIDGKEVDLENTIGGNNTFTHSFENFCSFDRTAIPGAVSNKYTEGWHHVEVTLTQMNELSLLGLWGQDVSTVNHGSLIDNVEIRRLENEPEAGRPLRVMLYNIQYGMWADQTNNFANFVAFINKWKPDVCIFNEAKSGWADGVAAACGSGQYHLFKNNSTYTKDGNMMNAQWKDLADRWGHKHHACSNNSQFPQVITSRYPITTKQQFEQGVSLAVPGESNVKLQRGAGHFQITVDGETINIVTLHLWPEKYRAGYAKGSAAADASAAKREGYDLQRREMKAILNATVAQTGFGDNWLAMGDMNSVSPLDEDYLIEVQYGEYINYGDKWVKTHAQVLQSLERDSRSGLYGELLFGRPLFDMLREGDGSLYTGPGRMITSTGGNVRYDIMYGSESMRKRVDSRSRSIRDSFSRIRSTAQYDRDNDEKQAKLPSDHLPVLVEFDLSK